MVTGAGGGLGTVVTRAFLRAGHRVAAVDVRWPRKPRAGPRLLAHTADLTSEARAAEAVAAARARFGEVNALLHLVGGFEGGTRVEETGEATWEAMLDANLRAAATMLRVAVPAMRARGRGRVVVVGAAPALHPVVTWSAFSASVAALGSLVQTAAAELRDDGVTVNAILPSTIATRAMLRGADPAEARRWVDPEAIASLMLWLCSGHGGDVTGALIPFAGRQPHPCRHWHGETG